MSHSPVRAITALLVLAGATVSAFAPLARPRGTLLFSKHTTTLSRRKVSSLVGSWEPLDDPTATISADTQQAWCSSDSGKEILLSQLDEMKTSETLQQPDRRLISESLLATDADCLLKVDEDTEADESNKQINVVLTTDDAKIMENVGAVLAASEEAVAAVDPTLQANDSAPHLVEEIVSAASSLMVEPPVSQKITAPSVGKILQFAIPAIGVWLCGPLLSLIDTSSVGLLSGTIQQAALNPAVAVTDYSALLIAFLYTATTNLIAAARESDRAVQGSPRTAQTLIGVLQLSTIVGAGLGLVLLVFARVLLQGIIGNDAINPAVLDAAMKYVRIRALGMPAAAVIGSAQAACLGMQDIKSPLYVLAAAAVVNFCGDMLFVGHAHPWIGGAAGAAWATVFSQYAAVGLFLHWLCHKPNERREKKPSVVNLSNAILELTENPTKSGRAGAARRRRFREAIGTLHWAKMSKEQLASRWLSRGGGGLIGSLIRPTKRYAQNVKPKKEESFSARGFLDGRFKGRDLVKVPPKDTFNEFKEYVIPVTSTQVGRVSGYVAMSHVVSSSLGTVSMAAQQVIVSLFYCLCPIADSLSLTAQSFVPAISEKKISMERTKALRQTIMNFMKAGGIFGAIMVAAVSCIPLLSGFFTTDPVVISLVNRVAPILLGWFGVHGIVCAAEGLLLGQKDLSFLGRMYAGYFAVVPLLMLRVKRAALAGAEGVGLTSVWKVFLCYQLFRFAAWSVRVGLLHRRTAAQTTQSIMTETKLEERNSREGSAVHPSMAST